MKSFKNVLITIIVGSLFTSCAALGKVIQPGPWLGILNLAAAAGISIFILKGSSK